MLLEKIDNKKITIILISCNIFQHYIIDNIKQLLHFNYNIIVITHCKYFKKLDNFKDNITLIDENEFNNHEIIQEFEKKTKLDKKFRKGFWNNTSKRLFILYACIEKYNLSKVVHIENDVLLYKDLNEFHFEEKIYLTMDSAERCIVGLIYIPNSKILYEIVRNYDFNKNDMKNVGTFFNKNRKSFKGHGEICEQLPIIKKNKYYNYTEHHNMNYYNENYEKFNAIFDSAAIGQYFGGVDPRNSNLNTIGYVNELCVVQYHFYNFVWRKKNDLLFPFIIIDGEEIPIINLHIHSKNLKKFCINRKEDQDNIIFNYPPNIKKENTEEDIQIREEILLKLKEDEMNVEKYL